MASSKAPVELALPQGRSMVPMRDIQTQIIAQLGVQAQIDPAQEIQRRVNFLVDYLQATGTRGFVLGISGGIDSTLAGRLCQLAVEQLAAQGQQAEFVAMRLPYQVQADESDAQAALDFIQPQQRLTFNIAPAVAGFDSAYAQASDGSSFSDFNRGNIKARARMIAQYAVAGERNLLVVGTDHAAEAVTGFYTKFGDGGADVMPLFGLNKRQNQALLQELGAPEALWAKVPTADLLDGQPGRTDEDELGVSYQQIDDYLEGKQIDTQAATRIEALFMRSRHKRTTPVTILDSWWQ